MRWVSLAGDLCEVGGQVCVREWGRRAGRDE
jgi:hypothetical protein